MSATASNSYCFGDEYADYGYAHGMPTGALGFKPRQFNRIEAQGSVRESGDIRERSAGAVRSGGIGEGQASAVTTEGKAADARTGARIDGGAGGHSMRGNAGEAR